MVLFEGTQQLYDSMYQNTATFEIHPTCQLSGGNSDMSWWL